MNSNYDYVFKILVVGDYGVGKSSLISRFVYDTYHDRIEVTIGVDLKIRVIDLDGKKIQLYLWDIGSRERFRTITRRYYPGSHGIVVVYDITDQVSFNIAKDSLEELDRYASANVNKLLIGTKSDFTDRRAVDYTEAKIYADSLNIQFLETSAKISTNVERAFMALVREIKSSMSPVRTEPSVKVPSNVKQSFMTMVTKIKSRLFSVQTKPSSQLASNDNIVAATSQKTSPCVECEKPSQVQCLHCSKHVCMDCPQKHVALAKEQVDVAQHFLNDKMSIIDRLSAAAKERVNVDRDKVIKQGDTERDQAFVQIDQLAEQQKKQIPDKMVQLRELPLDEISSFIQHMTSEMEYLNETNTQLFQINSTLPRLQQ